MVYSLIRFVKNTIFFYISSLTFEILIYSLLFLYMCVCYCTTKQLKEVLEPSAGMKTSLVFSSGGILGSVRSML